MNLPPLPSFYPLAPQRQKCALGLGYTLVAIVCLRHYLLWDLTWLLALGLVPVVSLKNEPKTFPWFGLGSTVLLIGLAAYTQVTTLYFFATLLAGWFALRTLATRNGNYPLLLLLIASPLFSYLSDVWSFPLRLGLSKVAATLLANVYPQVETAGNLILVAGEEYAMDPACAGLSMLSISMLLAVFLLARQHQIRQQPWPWWALGILLLIMLVLNLGSNLLRILLLVMFKIGPDQVLHDVVGLVCLVVYALLPFYIICRWSGRFLQNRPQLSISPRQVHQTPNLPLLNLGLLVLLALAGFRILTKETGSFSTSAPLTLTGFEKETLPDNVYKFHNPQALVYMKPVRGFYSAEHHPLICWEGSGYAFKKVRQATIKNHDVYVGMLVRGKDRLYTAWWMDNGRHQTIDQTDWRWRMLTGEPGFHLVNITTASETELEHQVTQLLYSSETVPASTAL